MIHQINIIKIIKKDYEKTRKYHSLSKDEKKKKKKTATVWCEQYKNLPEDEKQMLVEYRKSYYIMRKIAFLKL